jgi:hypothetical protein
LQVDVNARNAFGVHFRRRKVNDMGAPMVRTAVIMAGVLLLTPAAHAENWYVGVNYFFAHAKNSRVDTTSLAKSFPKGAEIHIGWEYAWYLGFEGRIQKGFGEDGAIHSSVTAPSFGLFLTGPKNFNWLYATTGAAYISIRSNERIVIPKTDAIPEQVTFSRFPTISETTWFVGGGVRYCGKGNLCPRAELGYRGSSIGGLYASVGIDIKTP